MSGFLLCTNVVSELRKGARTNPGVAEWYAQRDSSELFLSVITVAELRRGIALLRGKDLQQALHLATWETRLRQEFGQAQHLLLIGDEEAVTWGELMAIRTLPVLDGLLAATAKVQNLTLVTRNERDFAGLPITILNPFRDVPQPADQSSGKSA